MSGSLLSIALPLNLRAGFPNEKKYLHQTLDRLGTQTWDAALHIVPYILEVIQPDSVVDVGCATGEFLAAFRKYGIEDILGIDGAYVQRELRVIP